MCSSRILELYVVILVMFDNHTIFVAASSDSEQI